MDEERKREKYFSPLLLLYERENSLGNDDELKRLASSSVSMQSAAISLAIDAIRKATGIFSAT